MLAMTKLVVLVRELVNESKNGEPMNALIPHNATWRLLRFSISEEIVSVGSLPKLGLREMFAVVIQHWHL
jgi:hypothetical protein